MVLAGRRGNANAIRRPPLRGDLSEHAIARLARLKRTVSEHAESHHVLYGHHRHPLREALEVIADAGERLWEEPATAELAEHLCRELAGVVENMAGASVRSFAATVGLSDGPGLPLPFGEQLLADTVRGLRGQLTGRRTAKQLSLWLHNAPGNTYMKLLDERAAAWAREHQEQVIAVALGRARHRILAAEVERLSGKPLASQAMLSQASWGKLQRAYAVRHHNRFDSNVDDARVRRSAADFAAKLTYELERRARVRGRRRGVTGHDGAADAALLSELGADAGWVLGEIAEQATRGNLLTLAAVVRRTGLARPAAARALARLSSVELVSERRYSPIGARIAAAKWELTERGERALAAVA
jgi:hypothetical protein